MPGTALPSSSSGPLMTTSVLTAPVTPSPGSQGSPYPHSRAISPLLYRPGTPGAWPGFFPLSRHLPGVCIPQKHILLWRKRVVKGQHWKGSCDAEEGLPLQGDLTGPCMDMGFGFKDGRNFQKICLLKDRMASCRHSCECRLRRNSRTVWGNSQRVGQRKVR